LFSGRACGALDDASFLLRVLSVGTVLGLRLKPGLGWRSPAQELGAGSKLARRHHRHTPITKREALPRGFPPSRCDFPFMLPKTVSGAARANCLGESGSALGDAVY